MTKLLKWAAIQIYYYLIAADGEISEQELECFLEIAKETDPLFDQYKDALMQECKNQVGKIGGQEKRYDVLKEGIDLVHHDQRRDILRGSAGKAGEIDANRFIWNMLSIAMSDEKYADEECEMIQYVVEKFELDAAVFLELENAMKAIVDIDRSIARMTCKEKPFVITEAYWNVKSSEVCGLIDEFINRKEIIFNSVKKMMN